MQKHIECLIKGRVQGVMFRDFAQRNARKRGVVGWVKNELDGSVSLVAEGDEATLKEYIELIKEIYPAKKVRGYLLYIDELMIKEVK